MKWTKAQWKYDKQRRAYTYDPLDGTVAQIFVAVWLIVASSILGYLLFAAVMGRMN